MEDLLRQLLTAPTDITLGATPDVEAWWRAHRELAATHRRPADLALWGGFAADRPAWAFASGYQAALAALVPGLPAPRRVAFAATEAMGNHPRAIQTTLRRSADEAGGFVLDGTKTFVTLGPSADELLVLATRGLGDDGRPRLVVARISRDAPGVRVEALPPLAIVPELPHGCAFFEGASVPAAAVLPGDGHEDYSKPFRTVEDVHVHLALGAYLLCLARRHGAEAVVAELVALLVALRAAADADPKDPAGHVLLAGALGGVEALAGDARLWAVVDEATRRAWERDRPLLTLAQKARAIRLARAFASLGG